MSKDAPRTNQHIEEHIKIEEIIFSDQVFEDTERHFGIKPDWIKTIQIVALRPKSSTPLGTVIANLIRRDSIARGRFREKMSYVCPCSFALAFYLFNRYGQIRRELLNEPGDDPSTFGTELDHGSLLIIDSVNVDPHFRRRGVATAMLKHLFAKACDTDRDLTFILAWSLRAGHKEQLGFPQKRIGEGHWPAHDNHREVTDIPLRKVLWQLGFARLAETAWLALAVDPMHRSRKSRRKTTINIRVRDAHFELAKKYNCRRTPEEEREAAAKADAGDVSSDEDEYLLFRAAHEHHHPTQNPTPKAR